MLAFNIWGLGSSAIFSPKDCSCLIIICRNAQLNTDLLLSSFFPELLHGCAPAQWKRDPGKMNVQHLRHTGTSPKVKLKERSHEGKNAIGPLPHTNPPNQFQVNYKPAYQRQNYKTFRRWCTRVFYALEERRIQKAKIIKDDKFNYFKIKNFYLSKTHKDSER